MPKLQITLSETATQNYLNSVTPWRDTDDSDPSSHLVISFSASGLMDKVSLVKETSENVYASISEELGDFSVQLSEN